MTIEGSNPGAKAHGLGKSTTENFSNPAKAGRAKRLNESMFRSSRFADPVSGPSQGVCDVFGQLAWRYYRLLDTGRMVRR
jgi:hypothetical protein